MPSGRQHGVALLLEMLPLLPQLLTLPADQLHQVKQRVQAVVDAKVLALLTLPLLQGAASRVYHIWYGVTCLHSLPHRIASWCWRLDGVGDCMSTLRRFH